jgi:glycosyltransferase involved in cell wall biosynthesis
MMKAMSPFPEFKRIAFVSTRIAGTDGVSLEIEKWARVLERMGMECCYIAGESDRPPERSVVIPEAHFTHPDIVSISQRAFESELRTAELSNDIWQMSLHIHNKLNEAITALNVDGIIVENALTIPMNVPLGIALVQSILENQIPCLAHHHDFRWERERFLTSAIDDVLEYAFPPALPQIQHVVINSLAGEEFSRRTGLSCKIIPNVMDFDTLPPEPDAYSAEFRREIGLSANELLILQPTRVVARKGIEHSIELIKRLDPSRAKLVITHAAGDEGDAYLRRIREFAAFMGVGLTFANHRIAYQRGTDAQERKLFTIADAYAAADLVAYPSEYEGFGNAFLEAIYFKKPILCNRYAIYRTDIEPCGFRPILFDGFLTQETIREVLQVLDNEQYRKSMVDHNYEVASTLFGLDVVEQELRHSILRPQNIYRLMGHLRRGRPQGLA